MTRRYRPNPTHDRNEIWQDRAACKSADPYLFEVSPMDASRPGREFRRRVDTVVNEYCRHCPVMALCFRLGRDGHADGIWGGRVMIDGQVRNLK